MKHELLLLGKTKDDYIARGMQEFVGRLRHYAPVSLRYIKERKLRGGSDVEGEGRQLLAAVPEGWLKVVLDSRGSQFGSEEFADLLSSWELRGAKGVCYLIGGPTGHGQAVISQADCCLSLSKMTFTHDMVRLLLLEQLYRAYTIKGGEKYHK